jgi:hypothetical protein
MSMRYHVLASGSAGNASVLEAGAFGVLIDFGLPFRTLEQRLNHCSLTWNRIHAVLLTHTHCDHWQSTALTQLAKQGLPFYCHAEHAKILEQESRTFADLVSSGQVRFYEAGQRLDLHADCHCLPIALPHDGAMTCGFRFEGPRQETGAAWAVGYAADLGCWSPELAQHFADVDFLALEFNHDVAMQLESGRHPLLIRRVLGDEGHLSNDQAGALLAEIVQASRPGRLQALVQLHLSRECNRPDLAFAAAEQVLDQHGCGAAIHTAEQNRAGPTLVLGERTRRRARPRALAEPAFVQPLFRFGEEEEA